MHGTVESQFPKPRLDSYVPCYATLAFFQSKPECYSTDMCRLAKLLKKYADSAIPAIPLRLAQSLFLINMHHPRPDPTLPDPTRPTPTQTCPNLPKPTQKYRLLSLPIPTTYYMYCTILHVQECKHLALLDASTKEAVAEARSEGGVAGSFNFCIDCVSQEQGTEPHLYMGDGRGAFKKLGVDRMARRDRLGFAQWELKLLMKYGNDSHRTDTETSTRTKVAHAWRELALLIKTADAKLREEENIDEEFG